MTLDTNNHSVFKLNYKLVLVVKYGKGVINDNISLRLKEIFAAIAPKYNIVTDEWIHEKEQLQIAFKAAPNTEISKCINAYKSASSRLIKKEFPEIKDMLHKGVFWSSGYFLLTIGDDNKNAINNYINIQKMKDVGEDIYD
ncbi:IS200/IS605 family transposase [uncultured Clostridium sp.]|uniref:IS200/IS605 family transposase n=1 Tax=uncultured Clostridium sp. TaxID=59620 RepID=UPI0028ED0CD8|nr:IS200/IS605 family transposase [uncultured Clostridium sp.]